MPQRKFPNPYFIILLTLFLWNCGDSTDTDSQLDAYAGNYQIVSFRSDIPVDLNNDGITSQELVNEINSFSSNDLEIRPTDLQSNPTQLALFFFPKTWITFDDPGSPEGHIEFLDYGFSTTYHFDNNAFYLEDKSYEEEALIDNIESHRAVTLTTDLHVIDGRHLGLSISKEYYDFNANEWVRLAINLIYEKQ